MKQYITLGLFLFISLFSLSTAAQTVIFSEDFSEITTGNNTTTGGSGTAWDGNDNFTVDANSKAYEAGGAVKLGTGSLIGYITTIPLDLSQGGGAFTLSFDVKGWTTVEGTIKVTVTGLAEQTVVYTATMASGFETKTVNFTGGTANSTIRIETSAKRAFIDNVIVTVPEPSVDAPIATEATSISYEEFMANWEAVEGATGYRIDVSLDADFSTFVSGYENLAVDGTSLLVTGLMSNTVYYYRVRALDGTVASESSNVIDLATICGPFIFPGVEGAEYCESATVADLPYVGGNYTWYATETGGTPLEMDDPLATGTYYATQTINGCESERNELTVEIIVTETPDAEDMVICGGGTVADLMPAGENYKWYASEDSANALPSTDILQEGTYYIANSISICESERVAVQVSIPAIPNVPAGESTQDFTEGQTLADLDVDAENVLIWYTDADMTTELPATTPLVDEATYYAVNANGDCMSVAVPFTVNMTMGTSSAAMPGLAYYPNPVQDAFTLSYTGTLDNVTVYNMLGQAVISNTDKATAVTLNTSELTAGTYFVKVVSGAEAKTIKVVKQ